MNIMIGDTIVLDDKRIGIVENRWGNDLTVRLPDDGNLREHILRSRAKPLAEVVYEARNHGRRLPLGTNISLTGKSTLAELVALFGYSTGQMRRDSLFKVRRQLERAGIQILPETDRWSWDDTFELNLLKAPLVVDRDDDEDDRGRPTNPSDRTMTTVALSDLFWPTALGLDRRRELEFLRLFGQRPNPLPALRPD